MPPRVLRHLLRSSSRFLLASMAAEVSATAKGSSSVAVMKEGWMEESSDTPDSREMKAIAASGLALCRVYFSQISLGNISQKYTSILVFLRNISVTFPHRCLTRFALTFITGT